MINLRYLFFLIIFLIPIGIASAEEGSNYIKQQNPDGTITATLLPFDRIMIDNQWVNYNYYEDAGSISFESGSASFKLDKVTCDFKLYEKGQITKDPIISNYKMEYFKDNVKLIPVCTISPVTQNEHGVSFNTTLNGVTRTFDLNVNGIEWTSDAVDTPDGFDTSFKIIETCEGCAPDRIEGDVLYFGDYFLDLKNEQHESLKSVVSDKGDIVMEYEKIIPDGKALSIDPVFGFTEGTYKRIISTSTVAGTCSTTASSSDATAAIHKEQSGVNGPCRYVTTYYNIASIPDGANVYDVDAEFNMQAPTAGPQNCNVTPMTTNPSTATDQQILDDINDGTPYISDNAFCTAAGTTVLDLGTSADADVETALTDNEFAIGWFFKDLTRDVGANHSVSVNSIKIQITYYYVDGVTTLTSTDIRPTSVDLSWTAPTVYVGSIVGYQINSTTPWSSNVATVLVNNTDTTTTTYTVNGLTGSTPYSFRVAPWDSLGGNNATGNVLNVTTDFDPTGSFTPGTFSINFTGTDTRTIKYERIDIDDITLRLNVTADNDFNLACNFHYKFANINQTYTNIANVSINANEDESSFLFNDVDTEIIDVLCWDDYNNETNARYLITQSNFPFLEQIANFRNGTFGTAGQFGALDFITIIVVITSMVGFNRVNEGVGVILSVMILGATAVLSGGEIINWGSFLTIGTALIVFWAITIMRKD